MHLCSLLKLGLPLQQELLRSLVAKYCLPQWFLWAVNWEYFIKSP